MGEPELGDGSMTQMNTTPPSGKGGLVIAGLLGLVILGLAGGGAWWFLQEEAPKPVAQVDAGTPVPDAAAPEVTHSLEEGDALLAQAPEGPSNAQRLAKLLKREGMISTLTAAVNMVAEGSTPAPALSFITIPGRYTVQEDGAKKPPKKAKKGKKKAKAAPPAPADGRIFVSPASYARYDDVTALFTAMDAEAAAKKYDRLRPYFDTAFKVIGKPGKRFDDVLTEAIQRLVSVKLLEGKIELERKVVLYTYKDPALEAQSGAAKQLLRMGPKNGKAIQDYLRKFANAAGLKLNP